MFMIKKIQKHCVSHINLQLLESLDNGSFYGAIICINRNSVTQIFNIMEI